MKWEHPLKTPVYRPLWSSLSFWIELETKPGMMIGAAAWAKAVLQILKGY